VPVSILLLVGGVAVIALVLHDAYVTTVSAHGAGGPATRLLGDALWRLARRVAGSPHSGVLRSAGPVIVLMMLLLWLGGLWAGWTLIFSADPGAVVHGDTGQPADGWSRVYYAGFAVYTLGVGDFVPSGAPWQVLTALATINGFAVLTMTVSYLLPVVSAVTERRQHGLQLYGLGSSAQEILLTGWDGHDFERLVPQLQQLTPVGALMTQKFLSYPVLHYFHSPYRSAALEPGIAALDEALLVLEHGVDASVRLHATATQPLRRVLDQFAEIVAAEFTGADDEPAGAPDLEPLRRVGVPTVSDEEFAEAIGGHRDRRRALSALVRDALWRWDDAVLVHGPDDVQRR
jgi:hypothetical protein